MLLDRAISKYLVELGHTFAAVVVVGARQVGKTTLLQQVFGRKAELVIFDPVIDIRAARAQPDLFLRNVRRPVILDEIQYAPELVPALKRWIDQDRSAGQFYLTGSQQWEVMRRLAESLAGRCVFLELDGFSVAEVARQAGETTWLGQWLENPTGFVASKPCRREGTPPLFEQIWRGWLPEAQFLEPSLVPAFHAAYLRTYVERDARLLAQVDDWQVFARFFQLACALSAQEVNFSKLGRELGVTPQTSRRWLAMLAGTFQWFEVPAFAGNTIKRISAKPKGYISDTGLACHALALSAPAAVAGHPQWGALFETTVVLELRKQMRLMPVPPRVSHWRTHAGAEVDLVLERDGKIHLIEIKGTPHPTPRDASGLQAFRATYPQLSIAGSLVVCPCDEAYPLNQQDVAMPWDAIATRVATP